MERLRTFRDRLRQGRFPAGANPRLKELAAATRRKMREGLDDDMNTAVALAAIFDLVREANTAADAGDLKQDDVAALQGALQQFDEIFNVLEDRDAEVTRAALAWGKSVGRLTPEQERSLAASLSDAQIEALIAERQEAKKRRDYARADELRRQLSDGGVVLEDTKDGVRWKRR